MLGFYDCGYVLPPLYDAVLPLCVVEEKKVDADAKPAAEEKKCEEPAKPVECEPKKEEAKKEEVVVECPKVVVGEVISSTWSPLYYPFCGPIILSDCLPVVSAAAEEPKKEEAKKEEEPKKVEAVECPKIVGEVISSTWSPLMYPFCGPIITSSEILPVVAADCEPKKEEAKKEEEPKKEEAKPAEVKKVEGVTICTYGDILHPFSGPIISSGVIGYCDTGLVGYGLNCW